MLIVLPPSESKTAPARGRPLDPATLSFPGLATGRAELLDALVRLCSQDPDRARETLGLGPTQAAEVTVDAGLREAPTARADRIYSGVLYDALDIASLAPPARRRASRWLAVQSALFGLLRPTDRIPAYRLSGDVSLPGIGRVAAHWREQLAAQMPTAVGDGLLVDLRSGTYAAFWRPGPGVAERTATVRVLQSSGGRRTVVSHLNKATKGRLARSLLEHTGRPPRTPAALARTLQRLGWHVETHPPARTGTQLDVVVTAT